MDDNQDTNKNIIILIIIFLLLLLIMAMIVVIIIYLVPKNNVQEFGSCTLQTECANGLVCTVSSLDNTTRCLSGLNQLCDTDNDCATPFVCLENSNKNKICMIKPIPTTTMNAVNTTFNTPLVLQQNNTQSLFQPLTLSSSLACQSQIKQPVLLNVPPALVNTRVIKAPTCHVSQPVQNFNQIYDQIRQVDYRHMDGDYKKKAF